MAEQQRRGRAVGVIVAALLILAAVVAVNAAIFTWLYAPVMLAVEFTIVVFTLLAASIMRSACCDRRALQ
jgi:Flp pilus assembly protein TadB